MDNIFNIVPEELWHMIAHELPLIKLLEWSKIFGINLDEKYYRVIAIQKHDIVFDKYDQQLNGPWREYIDYELNHQHITKYFDRFNPGCTTYTFEDYIPLFNYLGALGPGTDFVYGKNPSYKPVYSEPFYDQFTMSRNGDPYYGPVSDDLIYLALRNKDLDTFRYYFDMYLNIVSGSNPDYIQDILVYLAGQDDITQEYVRDVMWVISSEEMPSLGRIPLK